jgi:hypothetical protein
MFRAVSARDFVSMLGAMLELVRLTIAGMSHHSGCAFSCTSCILCETWCGCAERDLHLDQPLRQVVKVEGNTANVGKRHSMLVGVSGREGS